MFLQIDMSESQVNLRPDGSLEILGQDGYIVVWAEYAERLKAGYEKFLKAYPEKDILTITVNIQVPQPVEKLAPGKESALTFAMSGDAAGAKSR